MLARELLHTSTNKHAGLWSRHMLESLAAVTECFEWHGRSIHASTSTSEQKEEHAVQPLPPGWVQVDSAEYGRARAKYRAELAALRNSWAPIVEKHNRKVAELKAARDEVRLAAQDVELRRQFERWVSPVRLRTADERHLDLEARQATFARHAMRKQLLAAAVQVARGQVIEDSATWATRENLDDYISFAMDNEQSLYTAPAVQLQAVEDKYECVAGVPRQERLSAEDEH